MTLDALIAREAIRDTLAAYNLAGDRARIDDFLACFTDDARYRSDVFDLKGRAAIAEWLARFSGETGVRVIRHHLTTSRITLEGPETACARSYYLAATEDGPDHSGVYLDRFRRVGDAWLIVERDVRLDWARPDTRFVSADALAALAVRSQAPPDKGS